MPVVAKLKAVVTKLKAPTRIRRSGWLSLLFGLTLLSPNFVLGAHSELSQRATALYLASDQLVSELQHISGYSNVRQRAKSLRREAEQLIEVLGRNPSSSLIRSQFNDISRRYNRLEEAFLRANDRHFYLNLYDKLGQISDLYANLSQEFYYASYTGPVRQQAYFFESSGHYDPSYYSWGIMPWLFGFQGPFGSDRLYNRGNGGHHDSHSERGHNERSADRQRNNQDSGSRGSSTETGRRNHYN